MVNIIFVVSSGFPHLQTFGTFDSITKVSLLGCMLALNENGGDLFQAHPKACLCIELLGYAPQRIAAQGYVAIELI